MHAVTDTPLCVLHRSVEYALHLQGFVSSIAFYLMFSNLLSPQSVTSFKNYWANVYNRQSVFFCSFLAVPFPVRFEGIYRVKLLMEVVCTAVLLIAMSHVWHMYRCICSLSDLHVTLGRVWVAVQFMNGLLVDQTSVG